MKNMNWKAEIIDFLKTLAISFIVIFVLTRLVIRPVRVNQNSMYPTVLDQSVGITNIFSVKVLKDIDLFDIVVVKTNDGKNLIKRVVGLPNQTISYKNDQLYIDGQPVEEDFLDQNYKANEVAKYGVFTNNIQEIKLGPTEIFCLGDNRPYSKDSRDYGPFESSSVIGKNIFVLYPLDRMGGVK